MADTRPYLTGVEAPFHPHELIVSKTDTRGVVTYANEVFLRVSGYAEREVLGRPHNLIRHPDMPRCVFRLLWQTIAGGDEIFAYVINRAKTGDHYWVLAHVTPTFDKAGAIVGYHSNRRCPARRAVARVAALYEQLLAAEQAAGGKGDAAVRAGAAVLGGVLDRAGLSYPEFVWSVINQEEAA